MQHSASILMYLRPIRLVYVRGTGTYETTIPETWKRLFAWLNANGFAHPAGRGYGLALDNPAGTSARECRYDACVALTPGMELRATDEIGFSTLPGGPYACRRLLGNYARVSGLVATAYADLVPFPGLALDHKRPVVSIYIDNPNRLPVGDLRADICLPVTTVDDAAVRETFEPA